MKERRKKPHIHHSDKETVVVGWVVWVVMKVVEQNLTRFKIPENKRKLERRETELCTTKVILCVHMTSKSGYEFGVWIILVNTNE